MSLPEHFHLKAANGKTIPMPVVGFGTWAAGDTAWAKESILTALRAGYRHIDGAWMYGVDEAIGQAIRESGIPREEIFVTTKIWPHFYSPSNVELCLDKVLSTSNLSYIDLVLAHWPCAMTPISQSALEASFSSPTATSLDRAIASHPEDETKPLIDWTHTSAPLAQKMGKEGSFLPTWRALQSLVRKGKARAVGVSNFSIADLEALISESEAEGGNDDDVPISVHQTEVHPWLPQRELIEFANAHGIRTCAYSPFAGVRESGDGRVLIEDPTVKAIAERNGMRVGQVLQSWAVQRGTAPLGKSATPERIGENLRVRRLEDGDMGALDGLAFPGSEGRTVDFGKFWGVPIFG